MKCPQCGNEIPDDSNFCPKCGQKIVKQQPSMLAKPPSQVNNTSAPTSGGVNDSDYRNQPGFKAKIIRVNIFGAIGFVFSGLGCLGSAMLKFKENLTDNECFVYLMMLIVGLLVGLLSIFVFVIPAGKKLFPDGKAKGFLENLPGVWMGFSIAFCAVALLFQGYMLIIS